MFSNEVEYVLRLSMRPRENALLQVWENIHDMLFNALLMMESVNNSFEAHAICKSLYGEKTNMVLNLSELKVLHRLSKLRD